MEYLRGPVPPGLPVDIATDAPEFWGGHPHARCILGQADGSETTSPMP